MTKFRGLLLSPLKRVGVWPLCWGRRRARRQLWRYPLVAGRSGVVLGVKQPRWSSSSSSVRHTVPIYEEGSVICDVGVGSGGRDQRNLRLGTTVTVTFQKRKR